MPSPQFLMLGGVILNLSHCDIKFISLDVPREQHASITQAMKNVGFFLFLTQYIAQTSIAC